MKSRSSLDNILIIGMGEVGMAINRCEIDAGGIVYHLDLDVAAPQEIEYDIAHICIPYSKDFTKVVTSYIKQYVPDLTIINSTVKPGTTDEIKNKVNKKIVYSPIRGVHPNLYEGVKTFVKYVGGNQLECAQAILHFKELGIKAEHLGSAKETELAKIVSTTYYGWNILFAKMINELCKKENLGFHNVYTRPNQTYNKGYLKLGKNNVIRPTLYPPEGKIGGHCVSENFELLPEGELKRLVKKLNEN